MSGKKYGFLNVIIVALTVILFIMAVTLYVQTSPRHESYYSESSANEMLMRLDYGGYFRLLEAKYENEVMGITVSNDKAYIIPYAIADYYEAAFNYAGYSRVEGAETFGYKSAMEETRGNMGEYSYIADEIDKFLGLD